jgi:hypothetical protein
MNYIGSSTPNQDQIDEIDEISPTSERLFLTEGELWLKNWTS